MGVLLRLFPKADYPGDFGLYVWLFLKRKEELLYSSMGRIFK